MTPSTVPVHVFVYLYTRCQYEEISEEVVAATIDGFQQSRGQEFYKQFNHLLQTIEVHRKLSQLISALFIAFVLLVFFRLQWLSFTLIDGRWSVLWKVNAKL